LIILYLLSNLSQKEQENGFLAQIGCCHARDDVNNPVSNPYCTSRLKERSVAVNNPISSEYFSGIESLIQNLTDKMFDKIATAEVEIV
jgi:hypothetical protein